VAANRSRGKPPRSRATLSLPGRRGRWLSHHSPRSQGTLQGPAHTIDEEEAFWKVIETSTNPVDFEEYLATFPQGRFVGAACAKLRQVRREASPSDAARVRTGRDQVQGTNPNGTSYQGTLTIAQSGAGYLLRWQIGRSTYQGQGSKRATPAEESAR